MRLILILLLAIATASTANAQRVFRASSIDLEQNDRLDSLESKVDRIESSVAALVAVLEKRAVQEPATVAKPAPKPDPKVAKLTVDKSESPYYSQAELVAIVKAEYPRGDYTRYADVSPRSAVWRHLQDGENHSFTATQVNGMSQSIALGLHGLEHAGKITPYRSGVKPKPRKTEARLVSTPAKTTTVKRSVQQVGGCASGSCARPVTAAPTQRVRLFNFLRR